MTANGPQWVRVIVGGLHTLAFGVNTTQSPTVVLYEVLGTALSRRLVLHERADLFVAIRVCRDKEKRG